jgi:hypothetical protein
MSPATRLATCSAPTSCMSPGTLVSERRSSSGSGRTVGYGPCANGDSAVRGGRCSSALLGVLDDVPREEGRPLLVRVLCCGSPTSRSRSPPCGCHQDADVPEEVIASSGNL